MDQKKYRICTYCYVCSAIPQEMCPSCKKTYKNPNKLYSSMEAHALSRKMKSKVYEEKDSKTFVGISIQKK